MGHCRTCPKSLGTPCNAEPWHTFLGCFPCYCCLLRSPKPCHLGLGRDHTSLVHSHLFWFSLNCSAPFCSGSVQAEGHKPLLDVGPVPVSACPTSVGRCCPDLGEGGNSDIIFKEASRPLGSHVITKIMCVFSSPWRCVQLVVKV